MSKLLQELPLNKATTVAEKLKLYNDCNREVAILCNHKRSVGAAHETQMEKLGDRIKGLRYQKWRTKMMMLDIDSKLKKKKGAEFFELDADLDDAWIQEHQKFLVETERAKIAKKFEKDNEKRVSEKEKPMPEKELKERLKAATELEAKFKKENKTKKVEAEGKSPSVEKLTAAIEKLDDRIRNLELQSADREGNKEVALGTSKIVSSKPGLLLIFFFTIANLLRTTLTPVSPSYSVTSSTSRLRRSSPRHCERSSTGLFNPSVTMLPGNSKSSGRLVGEP
jgi:DNA topoisomerase-1